MKLPRYDSLIVAEYVLSEVETLVTDPDAAESLVVGTYSNCREQGFSILHLHNFKQVAFAQYRQSDEIVVYCGIWEDFTAQNIPVEQIWRRANKFSAGKQKDAAAFILAYLTGEEEKSA